MPRSSICHPQQPEALLEGQLSAKDTQWGPHDVRENNHPSETKTMHHGDTPFGSPGHVLNDDQSPGHIVMDHFTMNNNSYGVVADRLTNWPSLYVGDSSMDVCKVLAKISEDYGIPQTLTIDGSRNYTSGRVKCFLEQYGIHHSTEITICQRQPELL